MAIELFEQETIIQFNRSDEFATIYTSDTTMITKLDKLCKTVPDNYKLVKKETRKGKTVSKIYRLEDKSFISLRSKKVTLNLTDEQRKERAERLNDARNILFSN